MRTSAAFHARRLPIRRQETRRRVDYTAGVFYQWIHNDVLSNQQTALDGFFGSPASPSLSTIDQRYQALTNIVSPSSNEETSFFGSLTAHFGPDTELTVGGRQIISRNVRETVLTLEPGLIALPASSLPLGGGCGPLPSTYAGFCDVPTTASPIGAPFRKQTIDRPFIYNVSLSHRFSRDFLVYANTGSSWRAGPPVVGIVNGDDDPTLAALSDNNNETSRSYEVGFKSTLLDGRARLNVALFRQKFHNLIIRTEPVEYLWVNQAGGAASPALFNFTTGVNALIEGFDVDAALQITPEWNVTAAMSYADGHAENGLIPCNGEIPAGDYVRMCQYDGSTSRDPLWTLTLTSEYVHPVGAGVDGFIRGLFNYYPENPRRSPGSGFVVDNYSLLNLYAGLRSQDGAWEVSVFAKNAFKTDKQLSLDANPYEVTGTPVQTNAGAPVDLSSGYYGATYTPRREVGVNVRYAFGSR